MSIETTIIELAELKKKNSKIGAKFITDAGSVQMNDVNRMLKPFADIEAKIDKAIKSLTNSRSIPKKAILN